MSLSAHSLGYMTHLVSAVTSVFLSFNREIFKVALQLADAPKEKKSNNAISQHQFTCLVFVKDLKKKCIYLILNLYPERTAANPFRLMHS